MNYNHPVGQLCGASDTTSSQYNSVSMLTMNCSTSLSMPTFGRSGIMWATTLKPASFDRWKDSHTARTVWPLGETYRSAELDYKAWRFSDLSSDRLVSHHVAFSSPPLHPTRWPVGVPGHVFVHALDSDLQPGAAVAQHVAEVSLQAVVGSRLDGDSHTLGVAALRVPAGGNQQLEFTSLLLIISLNHSCSDAIRFI